MFSISIDVFSFPLGLLYFHRLAFFSFSSLLDAHRWPSGRIGLQQWSPSSSKTSPPSKTPATNNNLEYPTLSESTAPQATKRSDPNPISTVLVNLAYAISQGVLADRVRDRGALGLRGGRRFGRGRGESLPLTRSSRSNAESSQPKSTPKGINRPRGGEGEIERAAQADRMRSFAAQGIAVALVSSTPITSPSSVTKRLLPKRLPLRKLPQRITRILFLRRRTRSGPQALDVQRGAEGGAEDAGDPSAGGFALWESSTHTSYVAWAEDDDGGEGVRRRKRILFLLPLTCTKSTPNSTPGANGINGPGINGNGRAGRENATPPPLMPQPPVSYIQETLEDAADRVPIPKDELAGLGIGTEGYPLDDGKRVSMLNGVAEEGNGIKMPGPPPKPADILQGNDLIEVYGPVAVRGDVSEFGLGTATGICAVIAYLYDMQIDNAGDYRQFGLRKFGSSEEKRRLFAMKASKGFGFIYNQKSLDVLITNSGSTALGQWALGAAFCVQMGGEQAGAQRGRGEFIVAIVGLGDGTFLSSFPSSAYWMAQKYKTASWIKLSSFLFDSPKLSMLGVHLDGHGRGVAGDRLSVGVGTHHPNILKLPSLLLASRKEALESVISEAIKIVVQERRCAVID
ncbi:hypothetical protein C8J56DRAFT_1029834 [Mycena floridula]|nr:hypothetical protein C8J56DRAFT_1029834 [Mycena floridula]